MENINSKIDAGLLKALNDSALNKIDYENLIETNPNKIRQEEENFSIDESPIHIPQNMHLENIDIPSSNGTKKINLRLYKPKNKENLPVFLYFHGGAFIYGTPQQYDFMMLPLSMNAEMIIVSVDYRLAPENPFPAGTNDGFDALMWLSNNANSIGGNSNKIIIAGSSAGATIAASVTQLSRDKNLKIIKHQYLLYPPLSHYLNTKSMNDLANAPLQTKNAAQWMWKWYLQDNYDNPPKYAVPLLSENFKSLPNLTMVVCELDPFKDEGIEYAKKIKAEKILVDLIQINGAVHAFDFFPCELTNAFLIQQINVFKQIIKTI